MDRVKKKRKKTGGEKVAVFKSNLDLRIAFFRKSN